MTKPRHRCHRLYELSARPWLYSLSQKTGVPSMRLGDVPEEEISGMAEAGITAVYLLGVWALGEYGLAMDKAKDFTDVLPDCTPEDIIGSPFAITEYRVNPDVGSAEDLQNFRSRLAKHGMQLFLDFVPNHTAVDAIEVSEHPEHYLPCPSGWEPDPERFSNDGKGLAFGRDDALGPWKDTLQHNYWSAEFRSACVKQLLSVAAFCDGVRVDMALLGLDEVFEGVWRNELNDLGIARPARPFWTEVITAARAASPDLVIIGEQYRGHGFALIDQGFDFVYDKDLLDAMCTGGGREVLSYLRSTRMCLLKHTVHFTSNHDEAPFVSKTGNNLDMARAATAIVHTTPGIHFSWMGDWEGKQNKLEIHLRRRHNPDEVQPWLHDYLINTLLPAVRHRVFVWGTAEQLEPNSCSVQDALVCYFWTFTPNSEMEKPIEVDHALTVVNFSDQPCDAMIGLPETCACADPLGKLMLHELISGERREVCAEETHSNGLHVDMAPWQVQILVYSN